MRRRSPWIGLGGLLAALAIAGGSACTPQPILVVVPFDTTDRAALIAIEDDQRFEVYAVSAEDRMTTPILRSIAGFDGKHPIRVTALFFVEPLTSLGIPPGRVVPAAEGQPSRGLPHFRDAKETVVYGDKAGEWTPLGSSPSKLLDLRLPSSSPCRPLRAQRFDLGGEPYLAALVLLDPKTALVGVYNDDTMEGVYYAVDKDGARRLPLRVAMLSPFDGIRTNDGRIWLTGIDTQTFRSDERVGDLDGGFAKLPPRPGLPGQSRLKGLVAPLHDEPADTLYAMTLDGQIQRFAGNEWATIASLPSVRRGVSGTLSWNGPNDLFVLSPEGKDIYRSTDGRLSREVTPFAEDIASGNELLTTVVAVPQVGIFSATDSGYVLERQGAGWRTIQQPLIAGHGIYTFAPFHDGMVIAGFGGVFEQYYPGFGFCKDVLFLGTDVAINRVLPFEGGFFVAGVKTPSRTTRAIYAGVILESAP